MNRSTLDSILSGMDNGGFANPAHNRDGHSGLGYISNFDSSQIGRSGNQVLNPGWADLKSINPHYDVIEKTTAGDILHHRIYKP